MRRFLAGSGVGGLVLGIIVFNIPSGPPRAQEPGQGGYPPVSFGTSPTSGLLPAPGPGSEFVVTPAAGPWLICVASYSGSDAPELGRQMVLELRNRHKLEAYTFNRGEREREEMNRELTLQAQRQQANNPLLHVRRRIVRIEDQVAVLIGGYRDEKDARQKLDDIRRLPPPDLHLSSGNPTLDTQFVIGIGDEGVSRKRVVVNPFSTAFVTPNPVQLRQKPPPMDPIWETLNRDEPYSLLKCPNRLTVMVKQYVGAGGLVQADSSKGAVEKMCTGGKQGSALDAASLQAHELARVLRQLNFQAYVLHTRSYSLVTVGGFETLEDAEYKRVLQQLAALQQRFGAEGNDPFKLNPIPAPLTVPGRQ
jgi:hypothetical protein